MLPQLFACIVFDCSRLAANKAPFPLSPPTSFCSAYLVLSCCLSTSVYAALLLCSCLLVLLLLLSAGEACNLFLVLIEILLYKQKDTHTHTHTHTFIHTEAETRQGLANSTKRRLCSGVDYCVRPPSATLCQSDGLSALRTHFITPKCTARNRF